MGNKSSSSDITIDTDELNTKLDRAHFSTRSKGVIASSSSNVGIYNTLTDASNNCIGNKSCQAISRGNGKYYLRDGKRNQGDIENKQYAFSGGWDTVWKVPGSDNIDSSKSSGSAVRRAMASETPSETKMPSDNVNVCTNQKAFTQALKAASEHFSNESKEYMEKNKNKLAMCVLLYLVLLVWAVLLAMRVQDKEHRVIHTVIALVCPPTYIIAYYLNNFGNVNKPSM